MWGTDRPPRATPASPREESGVIVPPLTSGNGYAVDAEPVDWSRFESRSSSRRLPVSALALFLSFAIGVGMAGSFILAYPALHLPLGQAPGSSGGSPNGTGSGNFPGGSGASGNGSVNTSKNPINPNGSGNSSSGNSSNGNSTNNGTGNSTQGNSTGHSSGNSSGNGTSSGGSTNGTGKGTGNTSTGNTGLNGSTTDRLGNQRSGGNWAFLVGLKPYAEFAGLLALLAGFAGAVFVESFSPREGNRLATPRWSWPSVWRPTRTRRRVDPRQAIAEALARLDWDLVARIMSLPGALTDAEIRARIVELYSQLLRSVTPGLGDLGARTPREIEALGVKRLGFRPGTARELTWLFEEARYSTHPISRQSLERARFALNATFDDLKVFSGAL